MHYTWQRKKDRRNLDLHGITFAHAVKIFDGPTLEQVDDRFDYGEVRIYAIGLVRVIEITVIYADTEAEETERHIISAWRSEPHERRAFWNSLHRTAGH